MSDLYRRIIWYSLAPLLRKYVDRFRYNSIELCLSVSCFFRDFLHLQIVCSSIHRLGGNPNLFI